MAFAFIIMQIGNAEMDAVCERAIVPAIEACGLEAKRVDKHNEGRLLNSEIAHFIGDADIVIADLTNERPNCYLEVGYTMGIGKYPRLVLTAREDHFHDSPNYNPRGPKIHFDLGGYDILQWETINLDKYRADLEKRIKGRLKTIQKSSLSKDSVPGSAWSVEHVARARHASVQSGCPGGFEIFLEPSNFGFTSFSQSQLRNFISSSVLSPFGMRVGMTSEDSKPRAMEKGVVAEFKTDHAYSYWAIDRAGRFYQELSLLEDTMSENRFSIDFQIMRATEALIFASRLLRNLKLEPTHQLGVTIRVWGLKDRQLTMNNPLASLTLLHKVSHANDSDASIYVTAEGIELNLQRHVKALCDPTFTYFDFFEAKDATYEKSIGDLRHQLNV